MCVGDFFDSFDYNSVSDVEKTCDFLRNWMFKDNFFSEFAGNHDLPYLYGNTYTFCSGYTKEKDGLITEILGKDLAAIRDKFKWYIWVDDYLCTHAGLHSYHLHPKVNPANKEQLTKWLEHREIEQSKLHLESGGSYLTYRAGKARYGNQKYGGLTWLDCDGEFEPIDGLKQIFGHSYRRNNKIERVCDYPYESMDNLCIDTNLNEYLIISNGKADIKKYADLD